MKTVAPTNSERVHGLDKIAAALGISPRKLHMLLDLPAGERPPVRMGHRGFYAIKSRLQDWIDAQDMDAGAYRALRRAKRFRSAMRGRKRRPRSAAKTADAQ